MTEKFVCKKCGTCCKTFSRNKSENDKMRFAEDGFRIVVPVQGNVIFGFEKHLFPKNSVSVGEFYFDTKSNKIIVINYRVSKEPCPNLTKDNECSIYNQRPVTCREFPCPYGDSDELRNIGEVCSAYGFCPSELDSKQLNKELGISVKDGNASFVPNTLRKKLLKRYGNSFLYALWRYKTYEILRHFISQLHNQKHVSLAKQGYDLGEIKKTMDKIEIIDIFDLYSQYTGKRLYNSEKIKEAIQGMKREVEDL